MRKRIGIIGNGVAGLQLAYSLKNEFDVTVHHYEDLDEIRQGRIRSTQVHFHPALERAQRFGMQAVDGAPPIHTIHFNMGSQKLFVGKLASPAKSVDQRYAFAAGTSDLTRQGVIFRKARVKPNEIGELAENYDLLIDTTGKSGPLFPFPIEQELTPFQTPQRKCIVGYFTGVSPVMPEGISITVLPGAGEMFEIPALTEKGPVTILFIEAVPEGPLDAFKGIKSAQDFEERMKTIVHNHFPGVYARIHAEHFSLVEHGAYLQTAITPIVRRPYGMHGDRLILGCGDSAILADPITGQGCNTASYCAEQLLTTLLEHKDSPWDEQVGMAYWCRIRPYVTAVTNWTNAMTGPLPEHIAQMLMQAAQEQEIANRIAHWFEHPSSAYEAFTQASERA
ncbi:2-polyprenyl-6-methoxyphenol hydroxylase-like FAD-dependent oxidoreductase [Paenibacillus phyllosphaerae]|uniref:2-polyprenyl-6-methoxyphenol hydroxylase-like FAD-dependent oxidoreductase n=1 Tax=Paenibacillus phyllosphaerae TaxID=274593 RepID=A0A7W5FM47_9BACL|nr:styrene monooxygenase/indole monooxygenase family protein [Paenibacillus phyllosphaerae]MBB3109619.1 2-polyprenyl-6-methoxyphenol hydroxylase-like FAD-dependent oxidoreductase [Paenibacillus phyllosphaerae]